MQPNEPQQGQQPPQNEVPAATPVSPIPSVQEQPPVQPAPAHQQPSAPVEQPVPQEYEEPYDEADPQYDGPTELPAQEPVRWQAVEYLQHDKPPIWYVGFIAVVIVLVVLAILIIKSWTFALLIPVMAVALMVYSHRPARELSYVLSAKGLYINDQLHPLGEFKGFGVIQDVNLHSLMLIPVKRFRPGLTVYFPTEVGEQIVDMLGSYLPMQDLKLDTFDKIVRKLRI